MVTKIKIKEFLNENSCLSNEWKEKLIFLIFGDDNEASPLNNEKDSSPETFFIIECMNFIEPHEGKRNIVYNDSRGIPTFGVGFNLTRDDASKRLEKYGITWHDVMNGKYVEDDIIYKLFDEDVTEFIEKSKCVVESFDEQPKEIKMVIVDMCFNLGEGGLSKFKKFIAALNRKDYHNAVVEMMDSRWYHQVGNRSKELADIVRKYI